MRLYVSGPVTGEPNGNRVDFLQAGQLLEYAGHEATAPHEFVPAEATHEQAMLLCINELTTVGEAGGHFEPVYDGIALLPGWEQSEGAKLEKAVAEACGIECRPLADWLGGGSE